MKKNISFILILFLVIKISAQQYFGIYSQIKENTSQYVYADITNVRQGPGINYPIIDKLTLGQEVIINNIFDNKYVYTQNGIMACWISVSYVKDGINKQGYVWEGNLTFNPLRRGNTKFIYGINAIKLNKKQYPTEEHHTQYLYKVELKILVEDKLIDKKIFYTDTEQSYTEANVYENLGLKDVKNIIRISFEGEACGIPSYYYYFAWNGNKILDLPSRYGVGDAGIFNYSEKFIFPLEKGGKPNRIIKKIESRWLEEGQEFTSYDDMSVEKKKEEFLWNGKNYKKIKKGL